MNIKTPVFKAIAYSYIILTLSSCMHFKSPQENLNDLKDGQVATVISGCTLKYIEYNWLTSNKDKETSCMTYWESDSGKRITLDGYAGTAFVEPGTYEFDGFFASVGDRYYTYSRKKKDPSMFTSVSVKGGEVVYIGDFEINLRKTKRIVQAITPVYYKKEAQLKHLKRVKPEYFNNETDLENKLQERHVRLTPVAYLARTAFPIIEQR